MKLPRVVTVLAAIAAIAVFVRLGIWQVSRLADKRAANASLRAALAAPPLALDGALPGLTAIRARRVLAEGVYDSTRVILLSDQWRGDSAGVQLLAPLRLAGGGVVLVDRGWLPSRDAIDAHFESVAAAGPQRVIALAEPLARVEQKAKVAAWTLLRRSGAAAVYSVRALDADTVAARLPGVNATYTLRALPSPGEASSPSREVPEPLNESMHVGYAIQWFAMATIVAVGSLVAGWRARKRKAS
jgi:surfeit locus 1 family protein